MEMMDFEKMEEIKNSVWECNNKPTLITLHDHYILFEGIRNETVIFYKDIITIKKNIQEINWDGPTGGGSFFSAELLLKTAVEDFELITNSPSLKKPYELSNDLYSQIINKMVENKKND